MKFRSAIPVLVLLFLLVGCGQSLLEQYGEHQLYYPDRSGAGVRQAKFTFAEVFSLLIESKAATASKGEKDGEVIVTLKHKGKDLVFAWQEINAKEKNKGLLLTRTEADGKTETRLKGMDGPMDVLGEAATDAAYAQLDTKTKEFIDTLHVKKRMLLKFICVMDKISPKTMEILQFRATHDRAEMKTKYSKEEISAMDKELRALLNS